MKKKKIALISVVLVLILGLTAVGSFIYCRGKEYDVQIKCVTAGNAPVKGTDIDSDKFPLDNGEAGVYLVHSEAFGFFGTNYEIARVAVVVPDGDGNIYLKNIKPQKIYASCHIGGEKYTAELTITKKMLTKETNFILYFEKSEA
ncbi:MAG: hypothetical protein LBP62_01035 [Clostridiales bacterium]|jgi:uncharacterized protein YpmB|nr:hypothetical protein [Clostridiales bacterium]